MEIITGYTGRSHITPSLDASINSAIFGNNNVVLNFGDKLSFSSPTIGKIVIGSGALCFSGRIAVSENSEEKNYTPPATGEYSHCKIVARYKKIVSDGTNIESISLVLLQSIDSATSETSAFNLPVEEYEEKVIKQSTTAADFVLYDFVVSNSEIVTTNVEPKFQVVDSIVSLAQSTETNFSSINNNIDDFKDTLNTNITDNSLKIKKLQEHRLAKILDTKLNDETIFCEIGNLEFESLLLFVIDSKISFIADFSGLKFTDKFGYIVNLQNGDYYLSFRYIKSEGIYKIDRFKFSKRTFKTNEYKGVSTGGLNKITIETLYSETEESEYSNLRIYRIKIYNSIGV